MNSSIKNINAIRIWDSRGNPTIETHITLNNDISGIGIAPSGASKGKKEKLERRNINDFIINDWWLSEGLETHIEDFIGFGATDSLLNSFDDPLIPIPGDVVDLGFETTRSGIWSIINNTLTLTCFDPNGEPMNSLSYNFTVNGDDLTIDLSLVGNEVYISTWERQ